MTPTQLHKWNTRLVSLCASVVHWWWEELRETWHAFVVRLAPGFADEVRISLAPGGGVAEWTHAGQTREPVDFGPDGSGPIPQDLRSSLPGVRDGTRVQVRLRQSDVLIRELALPDSAERELPSIIGLQLPRLLPLPPQLMYVDWYVRERSPQSQRIAVVLGAARCSLVDAVREGVANAGLRPQVIGQEAEAGTVLNFNPRQGSSIRGSRGRAERVLIGAMATLLFAIAILWPAQAVFEQVQLGQLAEAENARAAPARALAEQLRLEAKPIAQLQRLLHAPSVSEALAATTDALPSDSWAFELEIRNAGNRPNPTLKLKGFSPLATSLPRVLEKEPGLRSVVLIKSTAATGLFEKDRFEITAQVAPRTAPGTGERLAGQ